MAYNNSTSTAYGRRNRNGTILVPPTSDQCLVFPLNQETNKFDKGFYSPALTDGRLSNEQVGHFLEEVEETMKTKQSKMRMLRGYLNYVMGISVVIMVLYSLAVFADIDDDSDSYSYNEHNYGKHNQNLRHQRAAQYEHDLESEEDLFNMFVGWVFMIFGIAFWGLILAVIKSHSLRKAHKGVEELVERNRQVFAGYGLRWNVPLGFPAWIELWKDYKGQGAYQMIGQGQFNNGFVNQPVVNNQGGAQGQKYPTLNQHIDQSGYLTTQRDTIAKPLLGVQEQRADGRNYTPPYANMFVSANN